MAKEVSANMRVRRATDTSVKFSPPRKRATKSAVRKIKNLVLNPIDGVPGKLVYLNKEELNVDHEYQRKLVQSKVNDYAKNFSYPRLQVITVAQRADGTYWIIEGQHRWQAALLRSEVKKVPCVVHVSESLMTEAEWFLHINKCRTAINAYSEFHTKLATGDTIAELANEAVGWMGAVVKSRGTKTNSEGMNTFTAIKKMESLVAIARQVKDGEKILKAVCEQVKALYPMGSYIEQTLVSGLFVLAQATNGKSLSAYWTKRFKSIGVEELRNAADAKRLLIRTTGDSIMRAWAIGIAERGNHQLPNSGNSNRLHFNFQV